MPNVTQKVFFLGTGSGQSIVEIRQDSIIEELHMALLLSDNDTTNQVSAELSFSSTDGSSSNDNATTIAVIRAAVDFTTTATHPVDVQNVVTRPMIEVFAGERLFLNVAVATGTADLITADALIYLRPVGGSGATRGERGRFTRRTQA